MKKRYLIVLLSLFMLAALYLTAAYSPIPFIAKWRTIYIETALSTLDHRWLATALLPENVWKPVEQQLHQAEQSQVGLRTLWAEAPEPASPAPVYDLSSFLAAFPQVESGSLSNYLRSDPQALSGGWEGLQLFSETGLDVYTVFGDELLAVDVPNRLLILKVQWGSCTGAMAVCTDPARLSLQPSSRLGTAGETTGQIASSHGAVLAIPGSAFDGANDGGNGGVLAGYAMCGGTEYGEHLGEGSKRLEIRNHLLYITDSTDPVDERCTDAVEFRPALIVDGEIVVTDAWSGLHPRVCIGQTGRGEILMLVMEGRINGSASLGAALTDCANFLSRYGCKQAMNLDGGNSAMLWYDGRCITRCSDPEHPEGRPVPTAFVYG